MTTHLLIMLDQASKISIYNVMDQKTILEYKSETSFSKIFSNFNGTRIILIDSESNGHLFLPREEMCYPIEGWPKGGQKIIWDSRDNRIFSVIHEEKLFPFVLVNTLEGHRSIPVYEFLSIDQENPEPSFTIIDRSIKPIQVLDGHLVFLTQFGTIQKQFLHSHSHLDNWN